VTLATLAAIGISGCADTARVYPMDDAALKSGTPKIEFTRYGLGHGRVTVTMPMARFCTVNIKRPRMQRLDLGWQALTSPLPKPNFHGVMIHSSS
jgi:hypothetical protein